MPKTGSTESCHQDETGITLGVFGVGVAPLWTLVKLSSAEVILWRHLLPLNWWMECVKKIFVSNFGLLFNFTVLY